MVAPFQIYILTRSDRVVQVPELNLDPSRYVVHQTTAPGDALTWLRGEAELPDCLVVDDQVWQHDLRPMLIQSELMLPVVVLLGELAPAAAPPAKTSSVPMAQAEAYPGAVVHRAADALPQLDRVIQNAIEEFLRLPQAHQATPVASQAGPPPDSLNAQQHRLIEKLKARLGYLGVYYKRHPSSFLRNMSLDDRAAFLGQLKAEYRIIVLGYFAKDPKINLNQLIDDFVDQAFMADISVAQIVEIHMELMDSFAKQLKLEGRSEEILLDYRLTLIDVIAHLCEMYRRSIPREP
ncbi:MAG TPA: circadian clock protein KaiA [Nodosilinea sp.]|nr:circadian clock protein KaiA [Nodosilinea sp.]